MLLTVIYLTLNYIPSPSSVLYFTVYFGSKILPFTVFGIYLVSESKLSDAFGYVGFASILLVFCVLLLVSPFFRYYALVEWLGLFLLSFVGMRKKRAVLVSLVFAVLTVTFGSSLYEFPIWQQAHANPATLFYHADYPLFISTHWFSLAFLIFMLHRERWKLNRIFFVTVIFFLVFSVIYYAYPFNVFPGYVPRLPTIFMLGSLPFGCAKEKKPCLIWLIG